MPAGVAVCAYAGTIVQSLDCKDEAVRSDQSIPETRRKIKRGTTSRSPILPDAVSPPADKAANKKQPPEKSGGCLLDGAYMAAFFGTTMGSFGLPFRRVLSEKRAYLSEMT